MGRKERDAIVVGGSFAGLATAHFIGDWDILLLERKKGLGTAQRSTCCTSLEWMERLGCEEAVLQPLHHLTIYSSDGSSARVRLPEAFCTIDYRVFCQTLAERLDSAEILTGRAVTGISSEGSFKVAAGGVIYTSRTVVNASGYPGLNGREIKEVGPPPAFGLEVELPFNGDTSSFHIYYGKRYIKGGYGWIFPVAEDRARIGLGGFNMGRPLQCLDRFLGELGMSRERARPHGGYLPLRGLGDPVEDRVFQVGDACYQVLPTSGEGIRKAFENARVCGGVIGKVLAGEMTLREGLAAYARHVEGERRFYDNMRFIQRLAVHCPDWARNRLIRGLSKMGKDRAEGLLKLYLRGGITHSKGRILKTLMGGIL
ncbi:MAG: NAD(P)/FAD-dependent oxidoreductase [Methanobacteriota archaeon]|nr:MAG: NAD(P)/FAD-dependent oxidoreductase [Euryarchaeota archaeon]